MFLYIVDERVSIGMTIKKVINNLYTITVKMEVILPKFKTACNILGVRTSATLPEIFENFKKLVLIHHLNKGRNNSSLC